MEKRWSDKYVFVSERLDAKALAVIRFYNAFMAYERPYYLADSRGYGAG
jgi:hypothetical protein